MITNDPKGENKNNFKRKMWPHNLLQRKGSLSQVLLTLSKTHYEGPISEPQNLNTVSLFYH